MFPAKMQNNLFIAYMVLGIDLKKLVIKLYGLQLDEKAMLSDSN